MLRKPHRAYVLGAGPAGLLSAWACAQAGLDVAIYSAPGSDGKVKKSELHGCQYLHAPIPGLLYDGDPVKVQYTLNGSVDGYRRKVYGAEWQGKVSPDEYGPEQNHLAWNLRATYNELWEWATDTDRFVSCVLTPQNISPLYNDRSGYVFSGVPAGQLCLEPDEHKFPTAGIWAMGGTSPEWRPEPGANVPAQLRALPYVAPNNTVQCNGEDAPRWYRAASVFGYSTLEWPDGPKPPIAGIARVYKPLSTDCTCHTGSKRWHRIGRYGKWRKGVLVHTAYQDTRMVVK